MMTRDFDDAVESRLSVDEVGNETARLGGFVLKSAFQPIFRICGPKLVPVGVEGLVRPFHGGEPVAPPAFFEQVEDAFLAESLCRAIHLRNWRQIGHPGLRLFFNFSPKANGDLEQVSQRLGFMRRRLSEFGVDMSLLVCEITETEAISKATLTRLVARFREFGIRIAVDDFGTGSSTLERIELIAPDIVKVDGDWFRRVIREPSAERLLRRLFAGLKQLGCEILVEGVETEAEIAAAIEAGADCLQGFALGRPQLAGTRQEFRSRPVFPDAPNVTPLFPVRPAASMKG